MQKIFNENGRMDSTVFLLNTTAEQINVYFNRMANPEPFTIEPGEIVQCDGGVATIFIGQTWKYEVVAGAGGSPEGSRLVNERFSLAAFNTKEEAEAFKDTIVKPTPVAAEPDIVPTDHEGFEEQTAKKLNYSFMKKDVLVALAKEKYGAEFSPEAKRQEVINFLKENDNG